MKLGKYQPIVVNGWTIYAHPMFLDQYESLINQVAKLKEKDTDNYFKKNSSKRLKAIQKLAFEIIPKDPALPEYRQGTTLGDNRKYWFRAKFFQQYRLFFRFHAELKTIVLAWVNDEKNKRAYGSKNDAYLTFSKMLKKGHPPSDLYQLLAQAKNRSKD